MRSADAGDSTVMAFGSLSLDIEIRSLLDGRPRFDRILLTDASIDYPSLARRFREAGSNAFPVFNHIDIEGLVIRDAPELLPVLPPRIDRLQVDRDGDGLRFQLAAKAHDRDLEVVGRAARLGDAVVEGLEIDVDLGGEMILALRGDVSNRPAIAGLDLDVQARLSTLRAVGMTIPSPLASVLRDIEGPRTAAGIH